MRNPLPMLLSVACTYPHANHLFVRDRPYQAPTLRAGGNAAARSARRGLRRAPAEPRARAPDTRVSVGVAAALPLGDDDGRRPRRREHRRATARRPRTSAPPSSPRHVLFAERSTAPARRVADELHPVGVERTRPRILVADGIPSQPPSPLFEAELWSTPAARGGGRRGGRRAPRRRRRAGMGTMSSRSRGGGGGGGGHELGHAVELAKGGG